MYYCPSTALSPHLFPWAKISPDTKSPKRAKEVTWGDKEDSPSKKMCESSEQLSPSGSSTKEEEARSKEDTGVSAKEEENPSSKEDTGVSTKEEEDTIAIEDADTTVDGKNAKVKLDDGALIRAQVQSTMNDMLIRVQDRVMTNPTYWPSKPTHVA